MGMGMGMGIDMGLCGAGDGWGCGRKLRMGDGGRVGHGGNEVGRGGKCRGVKMREWE